MASALRRLSFDYAIVGAGASGMAFLDTLLVSHPRRGTDLRVALVDPHAAPGGHWNDDYAFVRLHQPSFNYGVMSKKLEDLPGVQAHPERRAARGQILEYYDHVLRQHMEGGRLEFFSGVRYDFESGSLLDTHTGEARCVLECDTLVDARFTQNDIPSNTPPRFHYNPRCAHVVPVNSLSDAGSISTESKNQNKG